MPLIEVLEAPTAAQSLAMSLLAALFALTGAGVYIAFGPPSKKLEDPFDEHED